MIYDAIIVGGGPAGISAGIQLKRANKSVAIIEKFAGGGQLNMLGKVENYPGFLNIDGADLAEVFRSHAKKFEVPFIYDDIQKYDLKGEVKVVTGTHGVYQAKTIVLAMGSHSRALNIKGEERFKGRGVSYCAVCDGNFFKGADVVVVGSGDSAVADTIYMAGIANKVTLLCTQLKLEKYNKRQLALNNVEIVDNAVAKRVLGTKKVSSIIYEREGNELEINTDAVFVAIGRMPDTQSLRGQVELDERGFIITDEQMCTSQKGVFACGDVRNGQLKQIATAVGEGAIAGMNCVKFR